jgi:hypothetical protein
VALEPEQREMFEQMVEAERNVPRKERHWFLFKTMERDVLQGPWGQQEVIARDLEELAFRGYLRFGQAAGEYLIDQEGRERFFEEESSQLAPAERTEEQARRLLDGEAFRAAYPAGYARWSEAEKLLWSADSERDFTTVGHKAREAMQEFATELIEQHQPNEFDTNPAFVKRRFGAVIAMYRPSLGKKRATVLEALGDYAEATCDVIERQEHGGQKEGHELMWDDARRVVLNVAVVLSEFAATLPNPTARSVEN